MEKQGSRQKCARCMHFGDSMVGALRLPTSNGRCDHAAAGAIGDEKVKPNYIFERKAVEIVPFGGHLVNLKQYRED